MIAASRFAAYEILIAISEGRTDLPSAIARSRLTLADDRDRRLAAEIATGVQRWRGVIDFLIEHFALRALAKLDREVVEILRLSVYQLLYLERVPASAVVNDAVSLARRVGKTSASGLVNAVLRAISRKRRALPLPPRPQDQHDRAAALRYLSITLSHPAWLVERWLDRFGFEITERWLRFDNTPAPLTLRANRLRAPADEVVERLSREDVRVAPGRFAPDALVVQHGRPLAGRGLQDGWFVVQDEASQLVPLLAGSHPAGPLLDACASPGGKTTALAAMMDPAGMLVAADLRLHRMELLRHTVQACRAANAHLVQADLLKPLPFSQVFDCALVDAPCSGLGTLRRDPDIRWKRREQDLAPLAAGQLVMLQHAAEIVRPGGRLIYATCSSEPEENESIAFAFARTTPDFEPLDLRTSDVTLPVSVIDERGHFRTLPHVHGLEAFFGAVFVRRRT